MTFEKSSGLSLQVQRTEEKAVDVQEFSQLQSHFEQYLRLSSEHQPTSNISHAVKSSKLFRDVPSLANDPHFPFHKRNNRPRAEATEELKPYIAASAWDAGRDHKKSVGSTQRLDEGQALGVIGRREQDRLDFLQEQENESGISSLVQRWQTPAVQSVRIEDIGPSRVPLKTKQTKRCPACRHIIVKSDPKAQSSRYKIKLMALNYLPELQIRPPTTASMILNKNTAEDNRRRSSIMSSRRREAGERGDEENLHPGRSYLFEASFLNPLDDAMTVKLHIAKQAGNVDGTHTSDSDLRADENTLPDYTLMPTTSAFPISAFSEVWELDEEDNDLFESVSKAPQPRKMGDGVDDLDDLDDDLEEDLANDLEHKRSRTGVSDKRERKRKGDGIIKRKGHETTIGLELALGREASGEIEFAMQVTYHYLPEAGDDHLPRSKKEDQAKSFSFWTVIRLGKISNDAGRSTVSGLPATTTEARRSALDKRRSIMGINVASSLSGVTSTLTSLQESN
ncbi:hypothetical protein CBS101457_002072 [Exobasidium rhododendri]|nr:hypothetical protein CBS101457_002072 [Exobasidium rhododendri]